MPASKVYFILVSLLLTAPAAWASENHVGHGHSPASDGNVKVDTHYSSATEGVPADQALKWLKNGNLRYTKNNLRKDGQSKTDRERLAKGQKPHSIVVACSDSRVPPEIVFDQKLGEIFVVRTAGEALDAAAIASIEYAVAHLGPKNIVVLGHESCGAIKATIETPKGKTAGSEHLDALISDIKPRLPASATAENHSENFVAESRINAKAVADDLASRSKIIADATKSGLKINSGVYRLKTGSVEFNP